MAVIVIIIAVAVIIIVIFFDQHPGPMLIEFDTEFTAVTVK